MQGLELLKKYIRHGQLTVYMPGGAVHVLGGGLPQAEWIVHKPETLRRIGLDPDFQLGETYMAGHWDAPPGKLLALFEVLMLNVATSPAGQRPLSGLLRKLIRQGNDILSSYRNVAHHYDLDEWLFRQFLDQDLQYSCAYFSQPGLNLEEAQRAKCRHILHKLCLSPGQQVLDIGCGWGGMALYLAEHAGVKVTGLTLSREQLRIAQSRAAERGLQDQVRFLLQDYREHSGNYDRIVSIGMFEHVGARHYGCYFERIKRLLHADGSALLHTIGRLEPPAATNPWIEKYIFPGGYNPALSEVSTALEKSGLRACDVEILRLHYAYTLDSWNARFQQHRPQIAQRLGERFCRMWEFYLVSCAAAFRWRSLAVFQLQFAHRADAVPVTRDYIYPEPDGKIAPGPCLLAS